MSRPRKPPLIAAQKAFKAARRELRRQQRASDFLVFVRWLDGQGIPSPVGEHVFDSRPEPRKWRFDYAWPEFKVALEVEGGVFARGRHTRGAGFRDDCEKYSEAAVQGWCVIRVLPERLRTLETADTLRRALNARH